MLSSIGGQPCEKTIACCKVLILSAAVVNSCTVRQRSDCSESQSQRWLTSGTSPRVKSYQLVKVVSGGRACGKSLILASTQLLVIE